MSDLPWILILTWALAAFFVVGAAINTFAVKMVGPEFQRWGYPSWFHFATGGLELATALLLLAAPTRPVGIALGGAIMLAAVVTVIRHGEYGHAPPPFIVLVLLAVLAWAIL